MKLFKCKHEYVITEKSNALQLDEMGYPLRLCCVKCLKCGKQKQKWIDAPEKEFEKLETGERVLVVWRNEV